MGEAILMTDIRIVGTIPWVKKSYKTSFEINKIKVTYAVNVWLEKADFGFDMGSIYSPLIKRLPANKRILITTEPSPFMGYDGKKEKTISKYYQGLILSWHRQLSHFPQYRRFNAAIPWAKDAMLPPEKKKFGISGFVSHKQNPALKGYGIRHSILKQDSKIKIPSIIWNHRKIWQGKLHQYPVKKECGHEHMFHLSIENCSEDGYFTEKILDCFRSFNVPVYYGDPNIGKEFNIDGIIVLNTKNPIIQINSLTEKHYKDRMDAMKDNYARAERYIYTEKLIAEEVIKLV